MKVPTILVCIKSPGPSIDLSTCVSAARLKTHEGLNLLKIFMMSPILRILKIKVSLASMY